MLYTMPISIHMHLFYEFDKIIDENIKCMWEGNLKNLFYV